MTDGADDNLDIESPDGEEEAIEAEVIEVDAVLLAEEPEGDGTGEGDAEKSIDEGTVIDTSKSTTSLAEPGRAGLPEQLTALNVYLARLKDAKILPIEEQSELAVRYQETGDADAAARLVASNLRLVEDRLPVPPTVG